MEISWGVRRPNFQKLLDPVYVSFSSSNPQDDRVVQHISRYSISRTKASGGYSPALAAWLEQIFYAASYSQYIYSTKAMMPLALMASEKQIEPLR